MFDRGSVLITEPQTGYESGVFIHQQIWCCGAELERLVSIKGGNEIILVKRGSD
jgi:hypothetical protein